MNEGRKENLVTRLKVNNRTIIYTWGERKNQFAPMECAECTNDSRVGHVFRNGWPHTIDSTAFLCGILFGYSLLFFFFKLLLFVLLFFFSFWLVFYFVFFGVLLLYRIFVWFLKKKLKGGWVGTEREYGRTHWKEEYNQYK